MDQYDYDQLIFLRHDQLLVLDRNSCKKETKFDQFDYLINILINIDYKTACQADFTVSSSEQDL